MAVSVVGHLMRDVCRSLLGVEDFLGEKENSEKAQAIHKVLEQATQYCEKRYASFVGEQLSDIFSVVEEAMPDGLDATTSELSSQAAAAAQTKWCTGQGAGNS